MKHCLTERKKRNKERKKEKKEENSQTCRPGFGQKRNGSWLLFRLFIVATGCPSERRS